MPDIENPPRHGEGNREAVEGAIHPHQRRKLRPPSVSPSGRHLPVNGEELRRAAKLLETVSATPRLDAELLMAHALGLSREAMLLSHLDAATPDGFAPLFARRMAHEPLAYITGTRDFWTITLNVAPGVLIPRPDSETLIEAAVAHFGKAGPKRVLDLGTGSGALLLAALTQWSEATGVGVDASPAALAIASANAARLGLSHRAEFREGDWTEGLSDQFDLILCNPPYVESGAALPPDVRDHEPASALFAGPDGLEAYRKIIPQLPTLLAPGGIAALEIGATQARPVSQMAEAIGLVVGVRKDLAAHERCLILSAGGSA